MSDNKKRGYKDRSAEQGPAKKKTFWQPSSGNSDKAIPPNTVGVLVTCDPGRERKSAAEMTQLFEEVSAKLGYTPGIKGTPQQEAPGAADASAGGASGSSKPPSIDALLAAEVAELKSNKTRPFKWHDTGVKATVFIECVRDAGAPPPVELVTAVLRQLLSSKVLPARHTMRLLPVEHTCFVGLTELQQLAAGVVKEHFPEAGEGVEGITFAVEFEHRSCNSLKRNEVIDAFAKLVPVPPHKVELNNPKKTILVQLVRNTAAVSVVEGYKELMRFNVRKAVEEPEEKQQQKPEQQQEQQAEPSKQEDEPATAEAAS